MATRKNFSYAPGILFVLLGILGLVTEIFFLGKSLGISSRAAYKYPITVRGLVEKVTPCINGFLCFKITESNSTSSAVPVITVSVPLISPKISPPLSPEPTDIKEISPTAASSGTPSGVLGMADDNVVGVNGNGPVGNGKFKNVTIPDGLNANSNQASGSAGCLPRPPCLDATPACKLAEPVEGWCSSGPKVTPLITSVMPPPPSASQSASGNPKTYLIAALITPTGPLGILCPDSDPNRCGWLNRAGDLSMYVGTVVEINGTYINDPQTPYILVQSINKLNNPDTGANCTCRDGSLCPGNTREGCTDDRPRLPSGFNFDERLNGGHISISLNEKIFITLHSTYWQFAPPSDPAVLKIISGPTVIIPPNPTLPAGIGIGTITMEYQGSATGSAIISASRTSCGEAVACPPDKQTFKLTVNVANNPVCKCAGGNLCPRGIAGLCPENNPPPLGSHPATGSGENGQQ